MSNNVLEPDDNEWYKMAFNDKELAELDKTFGQIVEEESDDTDMVTEYLQVTAMVPVERLKALGTDVHKLCCGALGKEIRAFLTLLMQGLLYEWLCDQPGGELADDPEMDILLEYFLTDFDPNNQDNIEFG